MRTLSAYYVNPSLICFCVFVCIFVLEERETGTAGGNSDHEERRQVATSQW